MQHLEDLHQERLFNWAKTKVIHLEGLGGFCLSNYLYAIPNGGKRGIREAARLKKQGVKAGVSDVHCPLPCNGFNGLWIEMKKPIIKGKAKPRVSESQKDWLRRMNSIGHKAVVAYGVVEAKAAIESYFSLSV